MIPNRYDCKHIWSPLYLNVHNKLLNNKVSLYLWKGLIISKITTSSSKSATRSFCLISDNFTGPTRKEDSISHFKLIETDSLILVTNIGDSACRWHKRPVPTSSDRLIRNAKRPGSFRPISAEKTFSSAIKRPQLLPVQACFESLLLHSVV